MENHPIPQDVTGFQFRLIGSLTVKQFGYLGVSVVVVVLLYYMPGNWLVKIPFMVLFGCIGPALAFMPVEGRPMDQMVMHFAHALFRPNQYLFLKSGGKLPLSMLELHSVRQLNEQELAAKKAEEDKVQKREEKLSLYLQQIHQSSSAADAREDAFMQGVLTGKPIAPIQNVAQPIPTTTIAQPIQVIAPPPPVVDTTVAQQSTQLEQKEEEIEKELAVAKQEEAQSHSPQEAQVAHSKVTDLSAQLQEALMQKAALEKEIETLRQAKADQPAALPTTTPPPANKPGAIAITPAMAAKEGIGTLPADPNLIIGIVKDPRGNVLPNLLVEIKDKDGNPVRAFKTNLQGQFRAATPLQNGIYTIVFEDPKGEHQFDIVELVAKGEAIAPIEVISHDAREALRQQLFG
jgi:hypothetical protein